MPRHLWAASLAAVAASMPGLGTAAPINSAKVMRIVEGDQVFIDDSKARVNQTAGSGSVLSTLKSRAELLFDTRALGLLGKNSKIRVGAKCFSIDSGIIVINGSQRACIGSRILGVRGTTYVVSRESDDTYTVSVLAGESILANDLPEEEGGENILNKYPTVGASFNLQAGGFGTVYPGSAGGFTGGISYFVPISQHRSRSITYSSSSIGSSFQNLWGISTEVGHRWLSAGSQSTTSAYLGYSGYGAPGCFSNLVNAGAQWEKSRWRIGGSGGIKVNNCPTGLSYGALNLSIPVGKTQEQPIYLSLSPYVLSGNVVGTGLLGATNSSSFPGIRATVELPINQSFTIRGYTGADSVYGLTVGGYFTYRIPSSKRLYNDPNLKVASTPDAENKNPASIESSPQSFIRNRELAQIAMAGQGATLSDRNTSPGISTQLQAQSVQAGIIKEGQRGKFSASGDLLVIEAIPSKDFMDLLLTNFRGQNPLPESRRIAKQALRQGIFNSQMSSILGIDFLNNASLPVSTTVDTPFSPTTQIPAGRYICTATNQARVVGAQNAKPGQFNYSGGVVYFGKGSQTSQGYPATYSKADAYVFSDPGVCTELNRLANQGYNVVQAEKI